MTQDPIYSQVVAALDNAVDNGYAHEFDRRPYDIVDEIHDWCGIEGFDTGNPEHWQTAINAVRHWREERVVQ